MENLQLLGVSVSKPHHLVSLLRLHAPLLAYVYNMRFFLLSLLVFVMTCRPEQPASEPDIDILLEVSEQRILNTIREMGNTDLLPRVVKKGETSWTGTGINNWTSGFFPGMLWKMYAYTGEEQLLNHARYYTELLEPVRNLPWKSNNLGFMIFSSYGQGYKTTGDQRYYQVMLQTADSLASLYNPKVGTILSWPWMRQRKGWTHNTIIDNLTNLELLFWAAKNGARSEFYDIAINHARNTLKHQLRNDYSTYHVVVYDTASPSVVKKTTFHGFSDESVWARGQAWAIYGFTLCYRETAEPEFLNAAKNTADYFLDNLPADSIPYWDFRAPEIPNAYKDASAAAIAASALIELSQLCTAEQDRSKYLSSARAIIKSLSSPTYFAQKSHCALLTHCVGNKPGNSEIDVSLIYADYYFLEALMRLKKIQT